MAFTQNFDGPDRNLEDISGWVHDGFIPGALATRSNKLACLTTDSTGSAYKCPDQGSADHYVQFRIGTMQPSGPFVCCRLSDRGNFIGIRNNAGTLEIYRRVSNTLFLIFSGAMGLALDDLLRFEVEGEIPDAIYRTYLNGVQLAGAAGEGSVDSGATVLNNTGQGLVARASELEPWIYDFEAGALGEVADPITADATVSEDNDTVAFSAEVEVQGSISFTENDDVVAIEVLFLIQAEASFNEADDTVTSVALLITPIEAAISFSEDDDQVFMSDLPIGDTPALRTLRLGREDRVVVPGSTSRTFRP